MTGTGLKFLTAASILFLSTLVIAYVPLDSDSAPSEAIGEQEPILVEDKGD